VWVGEPGLVAIGGWKVERETGEDDEDQLDKEKEEPQTAASGSGDQRPSQSQKTTNIDTWRPRASWSVRGPVKSVEVVQA
jgi:hypothetical protein